MPCSIWPAWHGLRPLNAPTPDRRIGLRRRSITAYRDPIVGERPTIPPSAWERRALTYLWSDHVARSGLPLRQDRHSVAIGMFDDLRARGVETDTLRQLPAATVEVLRTSGLARILQPTQYGGDAAPLATMIDVLVPIAAACGSTAWALAQYIMHNYMIARWPEPAQARVWGETPDALVAGILIPRLGKAHSGGRLSVERALAAGERRQHVRLVHALGHVAGRGYAARTLFPGPDGAGDDPRYVALGRPQGIGQQRRDRGGPVRRGRASPRCVRWLGTQGSTR